MEPTKAELLARLGDVPATGRSKGFGFVEMENAEDGERAIRELDGNDLDGRNLKVNEARPRE